MRFTSNDAYEAHEDGEPIMIESNAADRMLRDHGQTLDAFAFETGTPANNGQYDAWAILEWLGY